MSVLGKVVEVVHGLISIVDIVEVVGEFMGREDPAHKIPIDRVIFDNDNPERQSWGRIHDRIPYSHTRNESDKCVFSHLNKGCHREGSLSKTV